jgi:hypothetical protein
LTRLDPAIHLFRKKDARVNGVPADLVGGVPVPRMTRRGLVRAEFALVHRVPLA